MADITQQESQEGNAKQRNRLLAGIAFVVAFLLALIWPFTPSIEQPIRYNHQKHVAAGLECSNCHTLYESSAWAGLPTADTCASCHAEPVTDSPEEAKLVQILSEGKPIEWKQVNRVPNHVYFSHRTHTIAGEIECATCHGKMNERTTPPPAPFFEWSMDNCINCHEERNASVDCNACHR